MFICWTCSNIFRDFSGCSRPIFNCFFIIRFVFPLAFQRSILNCSTAKTREDIAKRKRKTKVRLFFIFCIRSNIFRDFSGCRRSILIPNYSTAKTREDMAKTKRKVENDCSAFLHFLDSFKHISQFFGL